MATQTPLWTLVQHSGFLVGGKPGFRKAVEVNKITRAEAKKVRDAGGLVFYHYGAASDAEDAVNYPADNFGLYPCCSGSFSNVQVDDGRPVYVATIDETEKWA